MKTEKQSDSFRFFPPDILALLGFPFLAIGLFISWFLSLQGIEWIIAILLSFVLAITGAMLLFFAKLPSYRQGHYFTFGIRELPESSRSLYWRGLKFSISGLGLALALLAVSLFWR